MTIAAAYSLRPRDGAPVSTPLAWEELDDRVEPVDFNIDTVLDRVREQGTVWAETLRVEQRLEPALALLTET